jgi:predicted transcriptional regulator
LTATQEAQLFCLATHAGTDTEHFVKDAALRLVEEWNQFSAAIREGLAEANRGDLLDDNEVRLWLEQKERSTVPRSCASTSNLIYHLQKAAPISAPLAC